MLRAHRRVLIRGQLLANAIDVALFVIFPVASGCKWNATGAIDLPANTQALCANLKGHENLL